MKTPLVSLPRSTYLRAIAKLSSGQIVAAMIPLAAAPLLSRLYLPADYGALGSYMALAGLFGAVCTLQLHHGIIAERSERRARDLVLVVSLVAGAVALVAGLVALAIFFAMAGSDAYTNVRPWVLVLPLTVLATGATAGIATLANRRAAYGALARIPVFAAVVTVATSIPFGLLGSGANGLFISYFLGQAVSFSAYFQVYRRIEPQRPEVLVRRFVAVARRHKDFVRYSVPSQFLSVVSLDMPVYALTAIGNMGFLGAFNRAGLLVTMPLNLIGAAVGQVFRQRAAEDYRLTGSCRDLYLRTGLGLFLAGLPPLAVIMLWAHDLFRIVLGPNWSEAGDIARILAPMLLLRLVCSPLSTVFFFTGRQKHDLLLTGAGVLIGAVLVGAPLALGLDAPWIVVGFAVSYTMIYSAYIAIGWRFAAQ
jgi:O-antigen/teichoic acid export membrane protein